MSPDAIFAASLIATVVIGGGGFFLKGIAEDVRSSASKVAELVSTQKAETQRVDGLERLLGRLEQRESDREKLCQSCMTAGELRGHRLTVLEKEAGYQRKRTHELANKVGAKLMGYDTEEA